MKNFLVFSLLILCITTALPAQDIRIVPPSFAFTVAGDGAIDFSRQFPASFGKIRYKKTENAWSGLVITTVGKALKLSPSATITLRLVKPLAEQGWKVTLQNGSSGAPMEHNLAPGISEYTLMAANFSIPDWYRQTNPNASEDSTVTQLMVSTPYDGQEGEIDIDSITITLENEEKYPKQKPGSGIVFTGYTVNAYKNPELPSIIKSFAPAQINILATMYADTKGVVAVDRIRTPTAASVSGLLKIAKQNGSPAGLYLYVDISNDTWRAQTKVDIESWAKAVATWSTGITVAPDFVLLGAELTASEKSGQDKAWVDLITSIRTKWPDAMVAYAFDRNSPNLQSLPSFIQNVDIVGITLWESAPDVEELVLKMRTILETGKVAAKTANKGFMVAEFGIPSYTGAIAHTWEHPSANAGRSADPELQATALTAIISLLGNDMASLWRIEPDNIRESKDYTVIGKPAEASVRAWLAAAHKKPLARHGVIFSLGKPAGISKANPRDFISGSVEGERSTIASIPVHAGERLKISGSGYSVASTSFSKGGILVSLGSSTDYRDFEFRNVKSSTPFSISMQSGIEGILTITLLASDWSTALQKLSIEVE